MITLLTVFVLGVTPAQLRRTLHRWRLEYAYLRHGRADDLAELGRLKRLAEFTDA